MDNLETKSVILGAKNNDVKAPETETKAAPNISEGQNIKPSQETKTVDKILGQKPENKTEEPEGKKPQGDSKAADVKKEVSKNGEESPKETKPTLKVDFGDSKKEGEKTEVVTKEATPQLTESSVLEYLNKNGLKVERLSDLSQKVTLNEEVEKFKKFNEETGLGAKEFYAMNRDWGKESKETRILEFLRLKNPNLSDEDIQTQLELHTVTEEDEAELSEREIKKRKLEFNKLDAEALSYLTQKSKEYAVPKKQDRPRQEPTKEDIAKAHRPYWDSRDKSLSELDDISFNIEGVGEIKLPINQDDKRIVADNTQTVDSMVNRWRAEDKSLDTKLLIEDNLWGIKPIREKLLASVVEQTHALVMEKFSKENRNVNLDTPAQETEKLENKGLIIEGGHNARKDKQYGKALI